MTADDRPTILVVDDERDIRIALEDLLEPEYRVVAHGEPAKALDWLQAEHDVSVIISDQRMPQMPGNRFLAAARAASDAEAILLTGYADVEAVIAAINEGKVAGYVHKPWSNDALRSMVGAAVERHRLRRALELERRLFDGLLDGSTDAIRLIGPGGETLRSNDRAGHVVDAQDRAVLGGGEAGVVEDRAGERWIRIGRIPLDAPDGGRLLLRIESDVTRERTIEARLRQAEKLQALGTLAGGIAHDFNNLLTAVIGNLELAHRRPDHPSAPRFVGNALEAARRGASLTGRLLSFSRQRQIVARAVDVPGLIAGMQDLLARTLGGSISVELDGCEGDLIVRADPDQLELALLNLCVNARDAMEGKGVVRIACSAQRIAEGAGPPAPGNYVRIAVSDTGEGMDAETQARVFEPFFTTKPVGKGTGLGLSMVYALATGLGGSVRIDSRRGEGATVSILLPRLDEPAAADDGPHSEAAEVGSLAILLVEDDPAVREVTLRTLEELGHHVTVASGPDEARRELGDQKRFTLLITDFAMPGGSGLDLAGEARDRDPGLAVLLLTGYAEAASVPADIVRLAKPFSRAGLAEAIARAVA